MPTTKQYSAGFAAKAAELKRLAGYRCQMCHKHGWTKETRPCKRAVFPMSKIKWSRRKPQQRLLTVHHINGDTLDDRNTNLIVLCAECHLRIETMNRKLIRRLKEVVHVLERILL